MERYDPKLKPYLKKLKYSYAFGLYPTIDLLKTRPDRVLKVLLSAECNDTDKIKEIKSLCKAEDIPLEVNDKAIMKLAYKENTYSIGIFEKYMTTLEVGVNHIVLNKPSNLGNIGTIIRTMVGFGIKDLALIKPAGDIFDPKVVRSAMGALFKIHFQYFDTFDQYFNQHLDNNMYPFMLKGRRKIKQIAVDQPFSLIFGNEGNGLEDEFSNIGQPVYIPQTDEIDSLNLSIAAGIAMWYFASVAGY